MTKMPGERPVMRGGEQQTAPPRSLPEQVIIGPVAYAVCEVDRLVSDGKPILGVISYKDAVISIDAGMPHTMKVVTFMHEVVHGVFHHAGIEDTESQVEALSYGLVDLFARNGWTIAMETA